MTNKPIFCDEYARVSRRAFLSQGLGSAGAFLFGRQMIALPGWLPGISLADPHVGPAGDVLVCIFLRGGADGLNMIVPHGDDSYYALRPNLGIPRPDDNRAQARTLDLDGYFGLHPTLAPLQTIYKADDIAFIHATGSPDETRSHFEAMELMERGATSNGDYTGWLARHLVSLDSGNVSALRAISVGDMVPASLNGAISATTLQSIAEYHLGRGKDRIGELQSLLKTLYSQKTDLLSASANQTFAAMEMLSKIDSANYQPAGRPYPERPLSNALKMVAKLIKAEVGLEVACVDMGGWDTHVAQGTTEGNMARLMDELARSLIAFYEDLQSRMDRVTVVVMSEFGRRVAENGGLGTDHGHGNMMMVMGGGINGGQVYARWPGLRTEHLVRPGDLAITTDYRDVLGEIILKRLNNPRLEDIFPGYKANELGLAFPD